MSNQRNIFTRIGASNHSTTEREKDDYYATHPSHTEELLRVESFSNEVWECAVGGGHIASVLEENGHVVWGTDIVNRGWHETQIYNFLEGEIEYWHGDIITNPPYKYAKEFVEKALEVIDCGCKVAMFLKLTFLEGQGRKKMFEKYPPKVVYVYSKRALCAKNGEFEKYPSSAVAYAWFVWEKGYKEQPTIRWI